LKTPEHLQALKKDVDLWTPSKGSGSLLCLYFLKVELNKLRLPLREKILITVNLPLLLLLNELLLNRKCKVLLSIKAVGT
jgi:hypothetical protein